MTVQSKYRPRFTIVEIAVSLRICQLKRQVFTVEDDEKAVQDISAQEDVGAVCCNAAHGREDKTFQGERQHNKPDVARKYRRIRVSKRDPLD